MKKFIAVLTAAALSLSMAGCGSSNSGYTVGVVKLASCDQLDAMYEGFVEGLADNGFVEGENLKIDYYDCENDEEKVSKALDKAVSANDSLIFAMSEPVAKAAAEKTQGTDMPVVAGAVSDFVDSGLRAGNITGTTDMIPVEEQIDLLHKMVPNAGKLAIVYNKNEQNSINQANRAAVKWGEYGLVYKFMPITYEGDAEQVMYNIIGAFDAVYMPSDSVVYNCIETMGEFTDKGRVPVIVGDEGMLEKYGLATVAVSYKALGRQSGEMAAKILKGTAPSALPVEKNKKYKVIVDESRKKALGIASDITTGEINPINAAVYSEPVSTGTTAAEAN